ncbi:hypothetical protein [Actinomyces vulturis]|uniref:hypothetical protein n=1 Tax=Actinomyces vulturis TaxID=1857645 RepID=UPI00082F5A0C|nr:hypothetical protein [Actinomyces vulturis]
MLASHYETYFKNANVQYIHAALTPADLSDDGEPVMGIEREKYPLLLALMSQQSQAVEFIEAEKDRHWDDPNSLYMQRYLKFYLPQAFQRVKEM